MTYKPAMLREQFTGMPRHSSGGIGMFIRTYVVRIICNTHAQVMEAKNSITLTIYSSEHVFIALRWRSEMIMGFHKAQKTVLVNKASTHTPAMIKHYY